MRIGSATSGILSGFLALAFLRLPFYLNILSGLAMTALSFTFVEPKRETAPKTHPLRGILKAVRYTLTHPKIRSLTLLSMLSFTAGITGIWSYYLLYQQMHIHLAFFGVLFAAFALCSGFGAKKAHLFEKRFGKKKSLAVLVLPAFVFILLGLIPFKPVIVLVLFNGLILGLSGPLILDYVNRCTPSRIRATVISVGSLSASLGFAALSPLFGKIADAFSLSAAFIVLGCFMLVCFAPVYYLLAKNGVIND
jgi:MFS family permease